MTEPELAQRQVEPLRILILAHNLRAAGGLAVGRNVISSLGRIRPQHHYGLIMPKNVGYESLDFPRHAEPFFFDRGKGWTRQFLFETFELPRITKSFRPDRVWGLGNFGLRRAGCPQAVLIHKPHYVYGAEFQQRERIQYRLLNAIGRRRLRRSLSATSLVFCQTRTICEHFRKSYQFAGKVSVMPSAVSELTSKGDTSARPTVFERLRGRFVLLCVSKYYAHKNIESLVDLMLRHGEALNDVTIILTVAADQHPAASGLMKRLNDPRLGDRLVNVGPIDPSEVAAYFSHSAGLILPTLLETFGLPYLEAMQFGRPILTSDLDFARDVCGPAARYFDPHDPKSIRDAILELKGSPARRDALVEAGRTRMTSFFRDWDSIVVDAMQEIEGLDAVVGR